MIFCRIGYIFSEPVRCSVGVGCVLCGKFYFSQKNALIFSVEHIQFNKKPVFFRDYITVFCDEDSVCLGLQVFIGLCCEWKILLLACHQSFGFISEKIVIVLSADADYRRGTEITLLDSMTGIRSQVFRQIFFFNKKFTFNFHNRFLLQIYCPQFT